MSIKLLSAFTIAATLLVATTANAEIVQNNSDLSLDPHVQTEQIKEVIEEFFQDKPALIPEMIRIADCESGGKNGEGRPNGIILHLQPNGQLTRNRTTGAAGAMQIYAASHSAAVRKQFDETDIIDNIRYARKLVDGRIRAGQNPFADWTASRSCWAT